MIRLIPGVTASHLYQWVAGGEIRAYRSRFTKWPLYSEREVAAAATGRRIAGAAPEEEMDAAFHFATRGVDEARDIIRFKLHERDRAVKAEDQELADKLEAELLALLRRPTNGGETVGKDGQSLLFATAKAA